MNETIVSFDAVLPDTELDLTPDAAVDQAGSRPTVEPPDPTRVVAVNLAIGAIAQSQKQTSARLTVPQAAHDAYEAGYTSRYGPRVEELEAAIDRPEYARIGETVSRAHSLASIVRLTLRFGDEARVGSGFFIGPNLIATAAHNLWDPVYNWAKDLVVESYAGGVRRVFNVDSFDCPRDYRVPSMPAAKDFGVIALRSPGSRHFLEIEDIQKSAFSKLAQSPFEVKVFGFPSRHEPEDSKGRRFEDLQSLYFGKGRVSPLDDTLFGHLADTTGGFSGGPALLKYRNRPAPSALGIHLGHPPNQKHRLNWARIVGGDCYTFFAHHLRKMGGGGLA